MHLSESMGHSWADTKFWFDFRILQWLSQHLYTAGRIYCGASHESLLVQPLVHRNFSVSIAKSSPSLDFPSITLARSFPELLRALCNSRTSALLQIYDTIYETSSRTPSLLFLFYAGGSAASLRSWPITYGRLRQQNDRTTFFLLCRLSDALYLWLGSWRQ